MAEHLVDAGQYLMHQHMPWLVVTTMLAFPLVVGVGGFLTADGSPLLLAAIAALPGLSVLAVVAAMGRLILLTSSEGICDVPNIPDFGNMVREARRFTVDAILVIALFFGPPALLVAVGAPWLAILLTVALGTFFAPVAFALRQIRGDRRSFAPTILVRAVRQCGTGYPIIAVVTSLLFAPAIGVAMAIYDRPVWVQIAIIGPMIVLPVFLAARLLGSWVDTHRKALGYLLHSRQRTLAGTSGKPAARAPQHPTQRRVPPRPAALEKFKPPVAKQARGRAGDTRAPAPARRKKAAARTARKTQQQPTPRAIEGRRPRPAATTPSGPTAGRSVPDLLNKPGAVVVSGRDRIRQGAASRRH